MAPLETRVTLAGSCGSLVLKVLGLKEMLDGAFAFEHVALHLPEGTDDVELEAMSKLGVRAVVTTSDGADEAATSGLVGIHSLTNAAVVSPGDVIRVRPDGRVRVLYRRGANANTLFVTERCNSRCLMCSQPPRDADDGWLVDEALTVVPLIDQGAPFLGVTGGEPTLLGGRLGDLIGHCARHLPATRLHVLTNGRKFADTAMADMVANGKGRVTWGIPLYADVPSVHDYVVQSRGAFDETVNGILNLAERGHQIEIRFVAHAQTLPRIERYVEFIYRNFPFVDHVALMGMEPVGFAIANRDILRVDRQDCGERVARAACYLADRGVPTSIYNVPLCALPNFGRRLARRSISDWKQTYAPQCTGCPDRAGCCGYFVSADEARRQG